MRPLDGLLVIDFSTLLPGPLAGLMLAAAGARVIKVERPGAGDDMRGYDPQWDGTSSNFAMLNAGKESVALDLKNPDDKARLLPLLERADVVIEQFRPGVMARLGLDYATLSARNPGLIYCSITGYGQSGPKRDVAAHDLNYMAETGLLGLSMGTPAQPVLPPALVADIAGGAYPAVMNILMALEARHRSGRGAFLDVAMTDNLFTFMYWAMGAGLAAGQWPRPGGELVTGGSPRYNLYPTRDGRMVAAAPIEPKFWANFCALIGLEPEFAEDAPHPGKTRARIAEIIASRDADDWAALFAGSDCCCVIVRTIEEAMADPHFSARGLFQHRMTGPRGGTMMALPLPLAGCFRDPAAAAVPGLGAQTGSALGT